MLLKNQKYVDPKIASKLHALQMQYQKLLNEKYQIQSNHKLQPKTKDTLLTYNQNNRYETKKMIQKYKLSLVDYFDQQVTQVTKNCILNGNNITNTLGVVKNQQKRQNDSLEELCLNQLNSTNDKIHEDHSDVWNGYQHQNQHEKRKVIKSNVQLKSDSRSTNNKSSFYSVLDKSKNDIPLQIGQFNITSKFQRLSTSRPQQSIKDSFQQKEKISSILQNYNKVSSIYYKQYTDSNRKQCKSKKYQGNKRLTQNTRLKKRLNKKDRIIQSLLVYINSLHQHQNSKSQDQLNFLSRITCQKDKDCESILKNSNCNSKITQKNKIKSSLQSQSQSPVMKYSFDATLSPNKQLHTQMQYEELLQLHREKNVLLQQKVKKLQQELDIIRNHHAQKDSSYTIQLNSIMHKNKELQKINEQNQELRMERMELMRSLKEFNKKKAMYQSQMLAK